MITTTGNAISASNIIDAIGMSFGEGILLGIATIIVAPVAIAVAIGGAVVKWG